MSDCTASLWLRPAKPLTAGRYALDAQGRLHPYTSANLRDAVAIVRVRCKPAPPQAKAAHRAANPIRETPAAGIHTEVEARPKTHTVRCDGSAPEGASGAVAGMDKAPANAEQTRPSLKPERTPAARKPRRKPTVGILAVEARKPVDYSRTVAAMRAKPIRKVAPPQRPETRCVNCGEPGPRVCEYCRAVEDAA